MPKREARRPSTAEETEHLIELKALGNEMEKVFGYLYDLAMNVKDHADHFDEIKAWEKIRMQEVAQKGHQIADLKDDLRRTKELVDANDNFTKGAILENDRVLKAKVDEGMTSMWTFQQANNKGLEEAFMRMEQQREAMERELQKLKDTLDATTAASSSSPGTTRAPPPNVPSLDPQSLAGCGFIQLREDVGRLDDQVRVLEVQVASLGGLQCPCLTDKCPCLAREKCKNDQGPAQGSGQGVGPAQDAGDPWWTAFQSPDSKKGPGGDGGDDDGGGDGGGAANFHIGTPKRDAPNQPNPKKLRQVEYGKLFEVKDAKSLPIFNGREKGAYWHKKISFYLASKCPEIVKILKWVEKQDEPITDQTLMLYGDLETDDSMILSRHLWGFLNVSLTDDAWEIFENIEKGNGFEAWRQVLFDVVKKTRIEKIRLERLVLNPQQCKSNDQVPMALERWAGLYKTYRDHGGEPLNDERRKGAIISLLPEPLQEKIVWDFDDHKIADSLISWIKTKVRIATSWKPGKQELYTVEEDDGDLVSEIRAIGAEASDEQIMAIVNKRFPGRNAPSGQQRPGGGQRDPGRQAPPRKSERGPPRSREDVTCPNCLKKGHFGSECPEGRVRREDRACFSCGEKGHEARHCKKPKPAQLLENDKEAWTIMNEDEFIPVQRRGKTRTATRPMPQKLTLKSFIDNNIFAAMTEDVDDAEETLEDIVISMLDSESHKDFPELGSAPRRTKKKGLDLAGAFNSACGCSSTASHSNCSKDRALQAERDEFLSLLLDDEELAEEELNAAEEEEFILMDVAADSGAGDNVASKVDAPGYTVRESAASKRGGKFVGAGGHRIKNQGEMLLQMEAPGENGKDSPVDAMFQVADVCRPLFSVSRICDRGSNTMTFDKEKAVVRNPQGKTICIFKRRGNLYIAQMKVRNPKHSSFGGQGK